MTRRNLYYNYISYPNYYAPGGNLDFQEVTEEGNPNLYNEQLAKQKGNNKFLNFMNSNGGGWANAIAPAATNIANAFLDTEASTADRVAGALGIPALANQWRADTSKGDAYIKDMQNSMDLNPKNYIQDASSSWGGANAVKQNLKTNITPISFNSAVPSLKDFKGNWWRNMGASVAQGAASGSVGGPWGALGGAVTGLFGSIGGLFGRSKRADRAYKDFLAKRNTLVSAQEAAYNRAVKDQTLSNMQALANGNTQQRINDMANIRAYGGSLIDPNPPFDDWYKTVPSDRNDTTSYNLRRAYELAPKEDLENWRTATPDELISGEKHLNSVYYNENTGEYEFMKSKNHPTLKYELDWYYGDTPEATDFRKKYNLDKSGEYYKYIPNNIKAYGGNLFDGGGDLTDEQQMVLADIQADPRILFTPKYSQWRDYIRRTSPDYLDRLYTSLPYEQQQDIYQNDREAWGALSNEAKGNFGGAQVRKKTDEVSPYVAGALGLVGAAPAMEAVAMFPMLENGLNAYFGYEGAKNLPTAVTDAYDYAKKGNWSRAGLSAGEAVLDGMFIGNGIKGIKGISNAVKLKSTPETMEFYHGGLDSDFDFNNLDVLKLAEKQAKRGKDYAGFYMYDPSLKMGAYKYGEGIGAHKINIDRNAKVLNLGDVERVSRTEIQKYKDLGYDMLTGKDVRGRREYVLLNKDAIKNTEYISPETIDSELNSIKDAPRIRFRDRASSDASYMPNTSNKISDNDWDNAYNAAIKSNDIEKAQRLRDAHFLENAGSDAITKEGRPEIIYHSISPQYNPNFNSFDTKIEGKDTFVYTTNNKNMSRSYTKGKEIDKNGNMIENEHSEMSENQLKEAIKSEESIIEYQLSLPKEKQNPAYIKNVQSSLEHHKKQFYNKKNKVSENYDADNLSTTKSLYGKLNSPWIIEGNYNNWGHIPTKFPEYNEIVPVERSTREVEDLIQINNSIGNKKYDGAIMNNISDWGSTFLQPERDIFTLNTVTPTVKPNPDFYGTVYSFENPKNLKYRDVITYDDSGNIIPLSKRDNFSINDLRYGLFPLLGLTSYGLVNNTEYAMGGNLYTDLSPNMMSLWNNKQQIDQQKVNMQQMNFGLGNSFNYKNMFPDGGIIPPDRPLTREEIDRLTPAELEEYAKKQAIRLYKEVAAPSPALYTSREEDDEHTYNVLNRPDQNLYSSFDNIINLFKPSFNDYISNERNKRKEAAEKAQQHSGRAGSWGGKLSDEYIDKMINAPDKSWADYEEEKKNGKKYEFPRNPMPSTNVFDDASASVLDTILGWLGYGNTNKDKIYNDNSKFYANGGQINSSDLPDNAQYYANGGTHEQNPYGGIQVGVDQQGNPNLVEEGEFRWGDYVFSDRINVDPTLLSRYNLAPATRHQNKKANKGKLSYADMAKKYAKKNVELANDPIGKNTLEAYMKRLQDAQEDQKFQDSMEQQKQDAINQYRNALTTPQQGNPMYGAMKYNGMGNAATQQGVNAGMSDLGQQGGGNEVLSNTNRSGNNMLHAFGGNLFWRGGRTLNLPPYGDPESRIDYAMSYTGNPIIPNGNSRIDYANQFLQGNPPANDYGVSDFMNRIYSGNVGYGSPKANTTVAQAQTPQNFQEWALWQHDNGNKPYVGSANTGVEPDAFALQAQGRAANGSTANAHYTTGYNGTANTNTGRSNLTDGIKRDTTTTFDTAATKEDPKQVPHYSTAGEYAMFGKGFTPMLYDWMNKTNFRYDPNQRPAYELADMGNNSTFLRTADTIGGYRAPNLMDVERLNNSAQANGLAALQAALNTSNGNRGYAAMQAQQQAYNTGMNIGNNYVTTQEANNKERYNTDTFNTALDQFNANARNTMYQDNQKGEQVGQQMRLDAKKASNEHILRNELYADRTNRTAMDNRAANQATWNDNALNYFIAQAQKNDILNAKNNDITNPYWTDKNGVMHYIGDSGLNSAIYDAFTSDKDEWGNYAVNNGTFSGDRLKAWNALQEKYSAADLKAHPELWKSLVLQEKQARKEEAEKADKAKSERVANARYAFDNNMAQLNNYRTMYGDKFKNSQWYDDLMKRYNDKANAAEFNDINNLDYWNRIMGDEIDYWRRYNTPVTANQSAYGGYINNNNKSNKREYYNYMRR